MICELSGFWNPGETVGLYQVAAYRRNPYFSIRVSLIFETSLLVDSLHRQPDQFHPAAQLELLLDVRSISLDRLDAEVELLRDLSRSRSAPHHLKDLQFTVAQRVNPRDCARSASIG